MSLSKMTVLAAGLALSLSTFGIAHAQPSPQPGGAQNTPGNMISDVGDDEAVAIGGNGRVRKAKIKVTATHMTKAQQMGARELPKGAMIIKKGGKVYILENKATTGNKTAIGESFQDMFEADTY